MVVDILCSTVKNNFEFPDSFIRANKKTPHFLRKIFVVDIFWVGGVIFWESVDGI
jgi:hypothetical protein